MKENKLTLFLSNIDKIGNKIESEERNKEIGKIINALQQPIKNVLKCLSSK